MCFSAEHFGIRGVGSLDQLLDPPPLSVIAIIPYHTMPCQAMPCHAKRCHAMRCHAVLGCRFFIIFIFDALRNLNDHKHF